MKRRDFIKKSNLTGAGALLGGKQVYGANKGDFGSRNKPSEIKNILLLFVDQQRDDCIGCYGNSVVQTPHIDRLAKNGIRFTNAYTPAPVCSPARTCLQTGLFSHNHGLIFNTGTKARFYRHQGGAQDPPPGTKFFSQSLKEKGWRLSNVGKWHIGTDISKPPVFGYDELPFYPGYGYPSTHPHYLEYLKKQGVNGFNLLWQRKDPTGYREYAALQEGPQSASIPAYVAHQTVDSIKDYTKSEKPFFIACNFWGPHAPYRITKEHLEMYRNEKIEPWPNFDCDLSDKPGVITRYGQYWKTEWFTRENLPEMIGEYYGYISLIDEEIGRILKALEDAGDLDKTLIVFSADHGSAVGSYRYWDKGFGMYDCITHIPMIISHPSIAPAVSDAFVTLCDLAPTFLEAAGCEVFKMDGKSLMPIIRGEQNAVRDDHIVTEHFGHQQVFWQRMVRTNTTKYIYNPTSFDEFYDLESDPWETKNIINTVDKKVLKSHRTILMEWMRDSQDPLWRWGEPML